MQARKEWLPIQNIIGPKYRSVTTSDIFNKSIFNDTGN
jgi:hypothetical protein